MCKEGELRSHGQMITKQLMTSLGQCVGITLSNCPPGAGKEFFYETLSKVSWCMLQILFEHVSMPVLVLSTGIISGNKKDENLSPHRVYVQLAKDKLYNRQTMLS